MKCDTAELARLIQQVNGGSMLDWAVFREGSLASWLRRDLEALLSLTGDRARHCPRSEVQGAKALVLIKKRSFPKSLVQPTERAESRKAPEALQKCAWGVEE